MIVFHGLVCALKEGESKIEIGLSPKKELRQISSIENWFRFFEEFFFDTTLAL